MAVFPIAFRLTVVVTVVITALIVAVALLVIAVLRRAADRTGSTTQLSGIAKLNTAKTFLTFGLTTADGGLGEAVVAQKL